VAAHPGPPSRRRSTGLLRVTEPARALASAGAFAAGLPFLQLAPRGEPHPVLVLPGLMASDVSTQVLRMWLRRLGYPVVGWELGRNRGPTPEIVDALPRLLDRLAAQHGTAVSIVGQSLGGIFARNLARRAPRQVRQVISLGSPFAGGASDDGPAARVYRRYAAQHSTRPVARARGSLTAPLPVPSTAVYSRWDGVVDWRACRQEPGPRSENVAVHASHLGMGHDPAVLWVIADRLAQPRHDWQHFRRPTRLGLGSLFPADG
jgi:pimeloyl-ACP methyl ester carboxylesterase